MLHVACVDDELSLRFLLEFALHLLELLEDLLLLLDLLLPSRVQHLRLPHHVVDELLQLLALLRRFQIRLQHNNRYVRSFQMGSQRI